MAPNVLDDELFTGQDVNGVVTRLGLAALIARLLVGPSIEAFPKLTAEQRSYFWRFLVRCAARALKTADLPIDAATRLSAEELTAAIRQALLRHTSIGDWDLYQDDAAVPAFMQVPIPGKALLQESGYRRDDCSLLTAIIGTKGHERKVGVTRILDFEAVVYALIEYQTGTIFGGRGNYESQLTGSRSGAASGTPFMGAWISRSYQRTFTHDVSTLLGTWNHIELHIGLRGSVWAIWRLPWNGKDQILSTELDPSFVPFARAVRLGAPIGGAFDTVWFRASEGSRVRDHTGGGSFGDPFTPIVADPTKGHLKVRGTLEKGYDYVEVVHLLFGDNGAHRSPSVVELMASPPGTGDLHVIFEGLALGQGKTMGFHQRVARLPRPTVFAGFRALQEPIDKVHQQMLENTQKAKRVLRSAMGILWKDNPRVRDVDRGKVDKVVDLLEHDVDAVYLDYLFASAESTAELPVDEAIRVYRQWLFDTITKSTFPEAVQSVPRRVARLFEAHVRAEAYLRGALRQALDLPLATYAEEADPSDTSKPTAV